MLLQPLDSLIGNFVVLLAAFVGFWGVIYSQRGLAHTAQQDRIHRENAAKEAITAERKFELVSLSNAFRGELSALDGAIGSASSLLQAQINLAESAKERGSTIKIRPRLAFPFATPVFDSHVGRIGLLPSDLAFAVPSHFGKLKAFASQDNEQAPEVDSELAARIMRSVHENLLQLRAGGAGLQDELKKISG